MRVGYPYINRIIYRLLFMKNSTHPRDLPLSQESDRDIFLLYNAVTVEEA